MEGELKIKLPNEKKVFRIEIEPSLADLIFNQKVKQRRNWM